MVLCSEQGSRFGCMGDEFTDLASVRVGMRGHPWYIIRNVV